MKYIGVLSLLLFLGACQSNVDSSTESTHAELNNELLLLQSEHNYLSTYLSELTRESDGDIEPEDTDSYHTAMLSFVDNLIVELESIATVINETESHSIALAYSTVNKHVANIQTLVASFEQDVANIRLNESQDIHFDAFHSTNLELLDTLETLRRSVETNDLNAVNQSLETLISYSNKY